MNTTQPRKHQYYGDIEVDNFEIKYTTTKDNIDDLFKATKDKYPLNIDLIKAKYVRINLNWNYNKREVKLSMTGYTKKSIKSFNIQHLGNTIMVRQNIPPEYSKKIQYSTVDTSPELGTIEMMTPLLLLLILSSMSQCIPLYLILIVTETYTK